MKWLGIVALITAFAFVGTIVAGGAQSRSSEAELLARIADDLRSIADGTCRNAKIC